VLLPCALNLAHGKVKYKFENDLGWERVKTKVVDLEKLRNFIVDNFLI